MPRQKQMRFQNSSFKSVIVCGGKRSHSKRRRPFVKGNPLHLVLKSDYARGNRSMLRPHNSRKVRAILKRQSRLFGVRILRYANVGNHLHLLIKAPHRHGLSGFLRAVCGLIARAVGKSEKGKALLKNFWSGRPFSRIVSWGRDYKGVCQYIEHNGVDGIGLDYLKIDPSILDTG